MAKEPEKGTRRINFEIERRSGDYIRDIKGGSIIGNTKSDAFDVSRTRPVPRRATDEGSGEDRS